MTAEPRRDEGEEARVAIEVAAFRLLAKFHRETDCGRPYHWAECERLADAFGYDSWPVWERLGTVR
jgi:hypothetical protein